MWNELENVSQGAYETLLETEAQILEFSSFPEDEKIATHLNYLSVLKFYNLQDLLLDIREKLREKWKIVILTKRKEELENIFQEENISTAEETNAHGIIVKNAGELNF